MACENAPLFISRFKSLHWVLQASKINIGVNPTTRATPTRLGAGNGWPGLKCIFWAVAENGGDPYLEGEGWHVNSISNPTLGGNLLKKNTGKFAQLHKTTCCGWNSRSAALDQDNFEIHTKFKSPTLNLESGALTNFEDSTSFGNCWCMHFTEFLSTHGFWRFCCTKQRVNPPKRSTILQATKWDIWVFNVHNTQYQLLLLKAKMKEKTCRSKCTNAKGIKDVWPCPVSQLITACHVMVNHVMPFHTLTHSITIIPWSLHCFPSMAYNRWPALGMDILPRHQLDVMLHNAHKRVHQDGGRVEGGRPPAPARRQAGEGPTRARQEIRGLKSNRRDDGRVWDPSASLQASSVKHPMNARRAGTGAGPIAGLGQAVCFGTLGGLLDGNFDDPQKSNQLKSPSPSQGEVAASHQCGRAILTFSLANLVPKTPERKPKRTFRQIQGAPHPPGWHRTP